MVEMWDFPAKRGFPLRRDGLGPERAVRPRYATLRQQDRLGTHGNEHERQQQQQQQQQQQRTSSGSATLSHRRPKSVYKKGWGSESVTIDQHPNYRHHEDDNNHDENTQQQQQQQEQQQLRERQPTKPFGESAHKDMPEPPSAEAMGVKILTVESDDSDSRQNVGHHDGDSDDDDDDDMNDGEGNDRVDTSSSEPPPTLLGGAKPANMPPPSRLELPYQSSRNSFRSQESVNTAPSVAAASIETDVGLSAAAAAATTAEASPATTDNAYSKQPWLPCKAIGVPKAALISWYSEKPRRIQVTKHWFLSWNDGGPPHALKFTSIFVCPMTGEIFASGRYGESTGYTLQQDPATGTEIVWYGKKILAEHGVAARAYDCFSHRHYFGTGTNSVHLGLEVPYLLKDQAQSLAQPPPPPLPPLPHDIQLKVDKLLQKVRQQQEVDDINRTYFPSTNTTAPPPPPPPPSSS